MCVKRVRQARQLVQRSEERGVSHQNGLRQEVLEVDNGRLKHGQVPVRFGQLKVVVAQALEIVLVKLRIVVNNRDNDTRVVQLEAPVILELLAKHVKGPALVRRFARDVSGQIWRVKSCGDEGKLSIILLLELCRLVLCLGLTLLESKANRQIRPAKAVIHQGMQRHAEAVHGSLVRRDHDDMQQVVPPNIAKGTLGPNSGWGRHLSFRRW
mmetsp:Transcript_22412/g.42282  ORF Transcript_22412/g.42282 Transcript_22412/m.42282 type:complete len:211 (+) Transcript_22412:950-1582(+)